MNSTEQTTLVESIGDFLLKKCMISGTSVKEISSRTGLTEQAIARLESGRSRRVDRVKIMALSEHLGFSINELVAVTNPRHPEPYAEGRADNENVDAVSLRSALKDREFDYLAVNDKGVMTGTYRVLEETQISPVSVAIDVHILMAGRDSGYEAKVFVLNERQYR